MRTYIDLLPEGKKNEIQRGKNMRTIISQEIGLAFPIIVLLVILLAINLILKIQIEAIDRGENRFLQSQEELKFYDERFINANSNFALVSRVQEGHLEWVGALTKLSQLFPEGVYLNGIATKDYRLYLIGKAKKRESLIEFQEAVKNSDCFTSVNAPLSNLVSRENIDFQIDFEIKKECLRVK